MAATSLPNYGLVFFAGGISSVDPCVGLDNVDIFNATNRTWSAAVLSAGRFWLAAASLPGLAFFAGGIPASAHHRTMLLTYSMRPADLGALLLSVLVDGPCLPHRCRAKD